MSLNSELWKLREKRLREEEQKDKNSKDIAPVFVNKFTPVYAPGLEDMFTFTAEEGNTSQATEKDIAPAKKSGQTFWDILLQANAAPAYDSPAAAAGAALGQAIGNTLTEEKDGEKWYEGWFQTGASDKDVGKTIQGTTTDAGTDFVTGFIGLGEGIVDWVAGLAPYFVQGQYYANGGGWNMEADKIFEQSNNAFKQGVEEFVAKDLYDEEAVAKEIVSNLSSAAYMYNINQGNGFATPEQAAQAQKIAQDTKKYIETEMEEDSVFAHKVDELMQSAGQLTGTVALQAVGVPWWATTGASAWGSETENALKQGATLEEANLSGLISASAEVLTEQISGGIKFGGNTLDDVLTKKLAGEISSKFWRYAAKLGMDMTGEGVEEVLSEDISRFGQWLTYQDEKTLVEMLWSEEAMDAKIQAFMSGAALGGSGSAKSVVSSTINSVDAVSGLTKNEQAVVDKIVRDEAAKAENADKSKSEIYNEVLERMDRGEISTDTIEEVLGDKTYKDYKTTIEAEESVMKELEELYEGDELQQQIDDILNNSNRFQIKNQLSNEVSELVKGDRLSESYNEKANRSRQFEADVTKYDPKHRDTIQKAIDSGILNNTRKTHEFVDIIAKISADKGVSFDFLNNQKLKESGFAVDGKQVNGLVTESGISINIDSPKAWQSTVGHEITHVLEGTDMYDALQQTLFDYAKSRKGTDSKFDSEYKERLYNTRQLYKDVKGYEGVDGFTKIKNEVTADLVGDYLFTDEKFIKHLSAKNRNVFEKIYDEIKYLCKVATAGSKEARELERVKKAFEDAYRAEGKAKGDTKYSISDSTGKQLSKEQQEYFKDSKMRDENGNLKVMYHGSKHAGFHVFDAQMSDDDISFFFTDSNEVASSYSRSKEVYEARTFHTAKDMNKFLAEIGYEDYEVVKSGGKYTLYYDVDEAVATSDNLKDLYDEFCDYAGVGEGEGNYKVYLNLKNPLVVDAEGRNWDNVSLEFYPELYEQWKNDYFTEEEKATLVDLAGWEDYSTFKAEVERAVRDANKSTADEYTKAINSAFWKHSDVSSLFSIASDNFSDDVLKAEALKQMDTRDYAQKAKAEGYDGVIFKNLVDIGEYGRGRTPSTVAIAFESNQIKSTANAKPTKDADIRYSVSEVTDAQNENGLDARSEVSFSLSKDSVYMDNAIAKNNSSMTVDRNVMTEAKAIRERIAARMNQIKDRGLVGLPEDMEGNTYIANSSYDGTEENTTICPRSLASEAFVDAVSEYLGRPLTVEEQIYISQDLQGRSLTPECTYCYVATDRKAYRAFLGEYVNQRDAVLQKLSDNPNADVSRSGELYKEFLNGRKDTSPMYSRFKMWVDAYQNGTPMVEANHLANINKLMGDIKSEFGEALKPQIVDAMKYAQSASWAKKRVNYVAYNGHILTWKQDRINKLNSHYGLRMYSFSDFHPAFVLENMQMITDASVRGLKMLGYTKDTDFVEIFAPSGMNINVSTFGFESGGNVYENNIIGAEWEKAKALREQYPNVGITFVATNDTLVNWALEQDWIDVVIPYHLVRTGAEVAKAFNYTNYTSESADTKTKDWAKGDKKYIAPTEHNNDLATYLAALEKNHLKPRFERFIDNPNYMKLVNECRQPASVSKPVQPVFNEEAAMKALAKLEANGYYQPIGGSVDRMYEIAAEVAEGMTKELAPVASLSTEGKQTNYGKYSTPATELRYEAPVQNIAPVAENVTVTEELFPDDLAPVTETTVTEYDAPAESKGVGANGNTIADQKPVTGTRKELQQRIVDGIKSRFAENGIDFDEVLKKAKNLSTFSTVDNTPQRVMEKALGYKEGQILSDLTVNQVAQNETESIKWLNSFTNRKNGLLAKISKQYNINPGSKESSAAQMYAEGFYVDEKNNIVQYGDAELAKDFPDAKVQQNIKGLANDPRIRQIYDDTLAMINESRTRNAYPEIPRLDNYFLHFRAMEDTFSRLGLPFNPNDIRAKDLPTDLNGVTADLKPGQPYFASAMHRTGKRTSFDLLGGLEKYLSSAKNQIYHIDDIQTLRALRNYVADTYGQANGLEGLDSLSEEEAQDRIAKVYNSHLSTFAKFLNEEANILAGKTSLIDRGLEGVIGRRGITFLDTVNKQVGSNMVGFNISSSLTNLLPVAQTFAKTNKADFVKAFGQTVANKVGSFFGRNDSFTENSPVVIRRKGADRFYRTAWQKIGDPGYALMGAVDNISTELIARTKYNELTRKGMDSQQAHYETDKWVSRLMGDRSLGQQPQLYNSKMLGLVTKFQLEVRNQLDSQFYDTIQETKASNEEIQNGLARNAKTAAKIASTFVQLAVVQHLFGKAFESVAGYNPAFDIIETLIKTFGWDDDEESEDTVLDNIEQGFLGLLEDLPYTSTFTGGRIPIESALPIEQLVTGKDKYGNEKSRLETLGEVVPYYLLPGGYGQIKKTHQGLGMFSEDHPIAGSYTDIGNLRFPVEDTFGNRLQAGIFGQYASSNARDYFDNDIAPLKEKQIQEFIDVGMTIQDYWDYRKGLSGLTKLAEKADYINSLDLTTEQKNILINNIADRKEDIDMSDYGNYESFEEFDFATKNPEKYVIAKSVGGYKNFKTYSNKLNDIKSDKDGDGKSISGSRKEKVINYVNGLDIDYGQKIILFKSEYKSDNTYNYDIVDYLNSRNDISYDEMVTILKELGFQVSFDGYVTW